jgi:hypothetical protein
MGAAVQVLDGCFLFSMSDLSRYDIPYILKRTAVLKSSVGNRNARMDRYEKMYRMDVWESAPAQNELRVTMPVGFDTVEKMRALLITRRPAVSVPYDSSEMHKQVKAQKLEGYLYGVMSRTNFYRLLADGEWNAMCLGQGILKACWMPGIAYDEFPLAVTAPDPRNIYGTRNVAKTRYTELVQTWKRSRREIRDEWGMTNYNPPTGMAFDQEAVWWDDRVNYIEYWVEYYDWEKVEPAAPPPKTVAELAGEMMLHTQQAASGIPEEYEAAEGEPAEKEEEEEPKRRRIRRIIHAVAIEEPPSVSAPGAPVEAGGVWVKKPTVVPGYNVIPYFKWSGISTPLPGENEDLSILYPLTNGDGGKNAMGVLAAMSMLASIDLTSAIMSPNSPWFTDDETADIDTDPNAINRLSKGSKAWREQYDTTNPAVIRVKEQLTGVVNNVTVPEVMSGQVYQLSGQAISGLTNAFQMLLAFKQQDRESMLEQFFAMVLELTKSYAVGDGWTAYGQNGNGRYVEQTVKPEDVYEGVRVQVKLSASLPKDEMAMMGAIVNLVQADIISVETALDQIQKLIGLAGDTPMDEMKRWLRDKILREGSVAKVLAEASGKEALEALAEAGILSPEAVDKAIESLNPPPQPPPGMMPPGQGMPPQGGPMPPAMPPTGGMPSNVMPPTPDMLAAAGNLQGAMNMQGGAGAPPFGGGPPPPPGMM